MPWRHWDFHHRVLADVAYNAGKFNFIARQSETAGGTLQTVRVSAAQKGCGARLDLAFLLDGSASVKEAGRTDQLWTLSRSSPGSLTPSQPAPASAWRPLAGPAGLISRTTTPTW